MEIKRGDIFYVDLGEIQKQTNIQAGIRPALILSNDIGNEFSPIIIASPLTSKIKRRDIPTHVELTKDKENGLEFNSMVLLEQIITIDKNKMFGKIGTVCEKDLENVNKGLEISLGLK